MKRPSRFKFGKAQATGKSTPAPASHFRYHRPPGGHGHPHHKQGKGPKQRQAAPKFGGFHSAIVTHHQPKATKKPKGSKKRRTLAGAPLGGGWLLGGNDTLETCIAAAVANHRLLVTGYAMSDAEILVLTAAGQTIEETLEAAGCRFWPVVPGPRPLVLGVDLPGPHAVLGLPEGWVSWGGLIRPQGRVEEAWWAEWPDDDLLKSVG